MVEAGSAEVYIRAQMADFERKMGKARGETKRFADEAEKQTTRFERSFQRSTGAAITSLKTLGITLAAVFSVRAISTYADRYTELVNIMKVVGGEQQNVNKTIKDLHDISKSTRAPLEAISTLYQRVSIAASELGTNQEKVLRFTKNVGLALAQQGGSAASASGALLQLSQAIGGGTVRAEEFNSILEGAYPIAMAAAKGLDAAGGSVAKLRSLVIAGKVSSKEFFDAILSQSEELEKSFAQTTPTIGQAFQQISDSLLLFFGKVSEATKASENLAKSLMNVANFVSELAGPTIDILKKISENMERILYWAGALATFITTKLAVAMGINLVQATTAAVGQMIALEFALGATSVKAALASVAIKGLTLAWKGFLAATVVGVLIIAVGELIYQFIKLADRVGGVGEAFKGLAKAATGLPPALQSIWKKVEYGFLTLLATMQKRWANFLHSVGDSTMKIPFMGDIGVEIKNMAFRAVSAFYETESAAGKAADEAMRLKKEAEAAFRAGLKLKNPLADDVGSMPGFSELDAFKSPQTAKTSTATTSDASDKLNEYQKLTKSIKDNIKELQIQAGAFGMTEKAADNYRITQELLNAASAAGLKDTADLRKDIGKLADEYANAEERIRQFKLAQDLTNDFVKGFVSDLRQGKSALEAFGNSLNRLADKLMDLALDSAINAFLGSVLGGGIGGSGGNIVSGLLSGLFGGARANGGPVQAGKAYLVNENTPKSELFVPNQNGMIIPDRNIQKSSSNSGADYINLTGTFSVQNGELIPLITEVSGEVAGRQVKQSEMRIGTTLTKARMNRVSGVR